MISVRLSRWFLPGLLAASLAGAASAPAQSARKRGTPAPAASASPKPSASASPAPTVAPYVLPDVVATVNGDPIKKKELENLATILAGNNGKTLEDLQPYEKQKAFETLLDGMIVDKLVAKASAGEPVDDMEVEKRYAELVARFPKPQDFDDQLKKTGQTPDQIRQSIRGQLAQQKWLEKQIAGQTTVTPQEVEKFYKESPPNKFETPEMVHAEHILVAVRKDATPEDALAAEKKAQELAARVKKADKGETFEDIARKQSDDQAARDQPATADHPAIKGNGGDLDWFSRDRIMPEFGDVAFKLKPGEVSGPVRTQFGYHLIKVVDRKDAHTATLDEAREQITQYLQNEKRQQAIAQVVAGLRAKADVKTFLPVP